MVLLLRSHFERWAGDDLGLLEAFEEEAEEAEWRFWRFSGQLGRG